jgi:hypothetical protein
MRALRCSAPDHHLGHLAAEYLASLFGRTPSRKGERLFRSGPFPARTLRCVAPASLLFRAMIEDGGRPAVGRRARSLGIRLGLDVEPDEGGRVRPGAGGLPVACDDPRWLPRHRLPPQLGGTGRDPVWALDAAALGERLTYRPDPADPERRGFIAPAGVLALAELDAALAATRPSWMRVVAWELALRQC